MSLSMEMIATNINLGMIKPDHQTAKLDFPQITHTLQWRGLLVNWPSHVFTIGMDCHFKFLEFIQFFSYGSLVLWAEPCPRFVSSSVILFTLYHFCVVCKWSAEENIHVSEWVPITQLQIINNASPSLSLSLSPSLFPSLSSFPSLSHHSYHSNYSQNLVSTT